MWLAGFVSFLMLFIFYENNAAGLIACPPNFCEKAQCKNVTSCPPGQVIKHGGFCGCCQVCHTILHEGDSCRSIIVIGGPPPTVYCDEGLSCINGTCQKK